MAQRNGQTRQRRGGQAKGSSATTASSSHSKRRSGTGRHASRNGSNGSDPAPRAGKRTAAKPKRTAATPTSRKRRRDPGKAAAVIRKAAPLLIRGAAPLIRRVAPLPIRKAPGRLILPPVGAAGVLGGTALVWRSRRHQRPSASLADAGARQLKSLAGAGAGQLASLAHAAKGLPRRIPGVKPRLPRVKPTIPSVKPRLPRRASGRPHVASAVRTRVPAVKPVPRSRDAVWLGLGAAAYRASRRRAASRPPIQCSLDIAVPLEVAYGEWMKLDFLPEGAHRVEQIERRDGTLCGRIPGRLRSSPWEAEILDERDGESFAWRSRKGSDSAGLVTFHQLADRLTRLELQLDVLPARPLEALALALRVADRHAEAELRRFKARLETISPDAYEEQKDSEQTDNHGKEP